VVLEAISSRAVRDQIVSMEEVVTTPSMEVMETMFLKVEKVPTY
jgi:hypothetical protein